MGSVCRLTHFLRAKGCMCPQNPSFDLLLSRCWFTSGEGCCCDVGVVLSCGAVEGCNCAAEGVVSWGGAGCACCAPAGIAIADARATMANWPGMKLRAFIAA